MLNVELALQQEPEQHCFNLTVMITLSRLSSDYVIYLQSLSDLHLHQMNQTFLSEPELAPALPEHLFTAHRKQHSD